MPVAAEADEIDEHVLAELVAVFRSETRAWTTGIGIVAVYMEDRARSRSRRRRCNIPRMRIFRIGGEAHELLMTTCNVPPMS